MVDQARAAAYHEAGHAVMVYYVGWILNPDGVSINPKTWVGYTGHRCRVFENTARSAFFVTLAGWLSEHKWHGKGGLRLDVDLEYAIEECRYDYTNDELLDDDANFFSRLLHDKPDITNVEMIATYRDYQKQVQDILNDPDLWKIVETVAEALLVRHQLYHDEVSKLFDTYFGVADDSA